MKFPISMPAYQVLFDEICSIYENAQAQAALTVNQLLVKAYWQIGKRIVTVEQKNKIRAEYGVQVLRRLSDDLMKKYPKGFSARNLWKMRQFYLTYSIVPTSAQLNWSMYQVLSTVKDPDQRASFERKAIKNGWKSRELAAVIKQDRVAVEPLSLLSLPPAETRHVRANGRSPLLSAKCGQLNLAKIVEVSNIHDSGTTLEVDVGFYHTMEIPQRRDPAMAESLQPGQIVEILWTKGGSRVQFKQTQIKRGQRYTYQADVSKVVDGDTLKVKINFGCAGNVHPRLRLRGINTPELPDEKGLEAKAFVEARLREAAFIIIKTHSTDLHGRFVADVWYLAGERDPQKVVSNGIYLNQELLDNNLAVAM